MEQQIKVLKAVEMTLQTVKVEGEENWDKMLGCVRLLRNVVHELEKGAGTNAAKHEGECTAD